MSLPLSALPRLLHLACSVVLAFLIPRAFAQTVTPTGSEFSLLDSQPGDQAWPQIALDSNGGYVVWQDNTIDGQRSGIGALRLNSRFIALSNAFCVNYAAAGNQDRPDLALLSGGGAVIVWQGGAPGFQQICARFLKPDGTFLTRDIVLGEPSSATTRKWTANRWIWVQNKLRRQRLELKRTIRQVREANQTPDVVALPDGGAVVVYAGIRKTVTNTTDWLPQFTFRKGRYVTNSVLQTVTTRSDNMHDIVLQRLSATGAKIGPEVTINQYTDFNQRSPVAALLPDGNLLVVWVSEQEFARPLSASLEPILGNPGISSSPNISRILGENRVVISARIVTPDGAPVADEFRIDGEGTTICANPDVNVLPDGAFTIAWSQRDITVTNGWDVYARTFASDRSPLTEPTRLNAFQRGDQAGPRLATLGLNQLVLWTSLGQDGSREGVYGRLLANGGLAGNEFRVNTTTRHAQRQPAVAGYNGEFLAVWSSFAGVASGMELLGQKFISTPGIAADSSSTLGAHREVQSPSGSRVPPIPDPYTYLSPLPTAGTQLRVAMRGSTEKFFLSWNTVSGAVYQIQTSTNLLSWSNLGPERPAAGNSDSFAFQSPDGAAFYRIKRVR